MRAWCLCCGTVLYPSIVNLSVAGTSLARLFLVPGLVPGAEKGLSDGVVKK